MKIRNIILSFILVVSFIIPTFGVTAYDDVSDYTEEINLLTRMGFMDGETSDLFYPDDKIDRAETVKILMRLRNLTSGGDGEQRFIDVKKDYYVFDEIDSAVVNGYIGVPADRKFNPESPITAEDALSILLRIMNYGIYLDSTGKSVIATASDAGLLKGVRLSGGYITKGQLAAVIYNSFSCGIPEISSVSSDSTKLDSSDKTTLSYHDMKLIKGVVTSTDVSGIYYSAKPLAKGKIMIGDTEYIRTSEEQTEYLGYAVDAIITDDSEETTQKLLYCLRGENNTEETIDLEDITDVNGYKISYSTNDRKKTLNLKERDCIIYNGTAVKYSPDYIKDANGTITTLENAFAERIVFIDSYVSYGVASVNINEKQINLANGTFNNKTYIDLDNDDYKAIRIYMDGAEISFSDILIGDVISVMGSDRFIKIINCRSAREISVSGITDDDKVMSDGKEYEIGKYCTGKDILNIGTSFSVTLDVYGRIMSFKKISETDVYGCILKTKYEDAEDKGYVKILDADSKINSYEFTDKVKYTNGDKTKRISAKEVCGLIGNIQVIKYVKDGSGKIKEVKQAADITDDLRYNEQIFTKYQIASARASYVSIAGVGYGNCNVFVVPNADDSGNVDEKGCGVKLGYFSGGSNYNSITFYDVGTDGMAKAGLVRANSGSKIDNYAAGLILVEKTGKVLGSDETEKTAVIGYSGGNRVTYAVADNYSGDFNPEDLSLGDLILIATDSRGEIGNILVCYDDSANVWGNTTNAGAGQYYTVECSVYHGTVRYFDGNTLTLEFGGTLAQHPYGTFFPQMTNTVSSVYYVNRETKKISMGDMSKITANNYYNGAVGSEVVTRSNRGGVQEVVVYEN